jgi:amidase
MNSSSHDASVRPLTATAVELQALLRDGKITSRELIEKCLEQIDSHNQSCMKLRPIISTMPKEKALHQSDILDEERKAGNIRGPFHGIPIIMKVRCKSFQSNIKLIWQDTLNTHPDLDMPTSLGTRALENARATGNAKIIEKVFNSYFILRLSFIC